MKLELLKYCQKAVKNPLSNIIWSRILIKKARNKGNQNKIKTFYSSNKVK